MVGDGAMAVDRCCGSIATGCQCQGTIFCSKGKMLCTKWSIREVPSSMLTAMCGAISNQTRVCESSRRRCRRIKPSNVSSCLVAVRREDRLFCFIRFAHSYGTNSDRIKFMPAPVSRRHTNVCIIVVKIPYDSRSVYIGLKGPLLTLEQIQ